MAEYEVTIVERITHMVTVDAKSEQDAYDIGYQLIQDSQDIETIEDREYTGEYDVVELS